MNPDKCNVIVGRQYLIWIINEKGAEVCKGDCTTEITIANYT